jgi:hypothetical protein
MFMVALDNLVVTNALAFIRRDLDASIQGLQWVTNSYILGFAGMLLVAAGLGDRFGRRKVFVAGLSLFVLFSVGCALSTSTEPPRGSRTVAMQGIRQKPFRRGPPRGAVRRRSRTEALRRGFGVRSVALEEWFPGAVQERLPEQPTRRRKALPGAKYSPDEFTHFPDQPADHDTEGSRAGCQTAHAARAWLRRLRG